MKEEKKVAKTRGAKTLGPCKGRMLGEKGLHTSEGKRRFLHQNRKGGVLKVPAQPSEEGGLRQQDMVVGEGPGQAKGKGPHIEARESPLHRRKLREKTEGDLF